MKSNEIKALGILRRVKSMSAAHLGERIWGRSKSRIRSAMALPAAKLLLALIKQGLVKRWWDEYHWRYQITENGAAAYDEVQS